MSDEFQLSEQLLMDVKEALQSHDSRTKDDMVAAQYLSALTGFILAHQQMAPPKKREILGDLNGFAEHVLNQVEQQVMPPPPPPPTQEAFGVWKPGDS